MEDQIILSRMKTGDKRAVLMFARANMNLSKAARLAYVSRQNMWYRLNKVKEKTGFDPFDFHDLARLVWAIEEERREYDRHN